MLTILNLFNFITISRKNAFKISCNSTPTCTFKSTQTRTYIYMVTDGCLTHLSIFLHTCDGDKMFNYALIQVITHSMRTVNMQL